MEERNNIWINWIWKKRNHHHHHHNLMENNRDSISRSHHHHESMIIIKTKNINHEQINNHTRDFYPHKKKQKLKIKRQLRRSCRKKMHLEDEWGKSAPTPPPLADMQSLDLSMSLENKKKTLSNSDLDRERERIRRGCDIVEEDTYHHWSEQERELEIERWRETRWRRKQMWITRNQ